MGLFRVTWCIVQLWCIVQFVHCTISHPIEIYRVKSEASVVTFCFTAGYIKCYRVDDRTSLKKAWCGSRDPCKNSTPPLGPLNFDWLAEHRINKFCARVGREVLFLWQRTVRHVCVVKVRWGLKLLANNCSYVHNSAMYRHTELERSNSESYMAYQMAPTAVTLNGPEGHSPVAGLLKCNPSNICASV